MEKFLSLPVRYSGDVLLNVNEVLSVTQASPGSLSTVVTYLNGSYATMISGPADLPVSYDQSTGIQEAITAALATSWTHVAYDVIPPTQIIEIIITP